MDYTNIIDANNLADAFWQRAHKYPSDLLYCSALASSPSATRIWRNETYSTAAAKISKLAHYLQSKGVQPGTAVAIMSNTRPEWMLVDMAIQSLGGIAVSIYQSLTAIEAGFIIFDSKASIIFIENEEQAQKIAWLQSNPCPIPERENILASVEKVKISEVIAFENISSLANVDIVRDIFDSPNYPNTPPEIPSNISRDSIASYVYTSGTTGAPKGVVQTHGNHLSNVHQAAESGVFAGNGSLFLYLPLAHSFARLVYYVGFLTQTSLVLPAITDHYSSKLDLASTARDIREGSASVVPSVPRLFEKMASVLKSRAAGRGISNYILRLGLWNAKRMMEYRDRRTPASIFDRVLFQGLGTVRAKVREQLFGANFQHAISGGARLDPEVNRFFESLEILICEGYGLTETCVATHVNLPNARKIGSVGPAFKGVEVKISVDDNEIFLRGPNITKGYLNRPLATREAWTKDGWFKTGDVGRVDESGFLHITDRKKELVITAGGKKIPPSMIEGIFKRVPFISQAFLFGEGRPYCVMLFTLNEVELRALLKSTGIDITAGQSLSKISWVKDKVDAAVGEANSQLASYESVKRYAILDEDFSVENGLLTPTLKMKRKVITEKFADVINSLYHE